MEYPFTNVVYALLGYLGIVVIIFAALIITNRDEAEQDIKEQEDFNNTKN